MHVFPEFFAHILSFWYSLTNDYAAAILLLTVTVMIVVLPLTLKATRSMIILQKVAPELQKLQDKYKNDRQRLNEEMMAFYKEEKINPLSGCFPILLQAPIFLILYQTLRGLTSRDAAGLSTPKYLDHTTQLYKDIVAANGEMVSFGMDFAKKATDFKSFDHWYMAIPFFALIFIQVGFQYWQQRQLSSRAAATPNNPQAEMMKKFQKIMPPFFGIISLGFPAALVLYYAAQSVIRVFQQWAMYRFDPRLKDSVDHARKDAASHVKGGKSKASTKVVESKVRDTSAGVSKSKPTSKSKRKGR